MSGKEKKANDLSEGTLVTISGLESEKGKALNGASGIILGPPSAAADTTDARRYPVLVYALLSLQKNEKDNAVLELADPPLKRSIKSVNVEEKSNQKCELYKEAAQTHAEKSYNTGNSKETLFWLSGYYERWPEDYRLSVSYANLLRAVLEEPVEALKVLRETVPHMDPNSPTINEWRYDMCITICAAKGKPEEALEWALEIRTDTADYKQLSIEALMEVAEYSRKADSGRLVDLDSGDGPLLEVHRMAVMAALEREPENARFMQNAAAANCLLENNREGVRLYRNALTSGQIEGKELESLKIDLALAMMQCPGGLMEHYRVIGFAGDKWAGIHKTAIGQYELCQRAHDDGSLMSGLLAGPNGVEVTMFPVPDIDDTQLFQNVDLPLWE